jgi:hypothetical protein
MSHDKYGDTDLVYWMGKSINAMTREELQTALGEAIMAIEHLKRKTAYQTAYIQYAELRIKENVDAQNNSRFTNESYINSFC